HGSRSGMINVSGDFTGAAPSATLAGNGTIPAAAWSPTSFTFAEQLVGTRSGNRGFALTNSGDGPLTITAITATGDFITGNNCGGTLAAGASCTVVVSFLPTATGTRTGSLSLSSNSSTTVSPITLTGTGVDQALVVSPASLTFANQLLNTTTTSQGVI